MKAQDYIRKMKKTVQDRSKKDDICQELMDCIEDFIEEYMEQGMSREEAEAEAVKQMGNPVEAGDMFNSVYRPKFEWRASAYMLAWIIFTAIMKFVLLWTYNGMEALRDLPDFMIIIEVLGILLILFGIGLSYWEKCDDNPFLWWKTVPTKYWAMPGWGAFTNSCTFAGMGITLLAENMQQTIILYGGITIVLLFQRLYIVNQQSAREQHYIYKECTALESFNYQGMVEIEGEQQRVMILYGENVKKGDELIITGMKGFTVVVEKM